MNNAKWNKLLQALRQTDSIDDRTMLNLLDDGKQSVFYHDGCKGNVPKLKKFLTKNQFEHNNESIIGYVNSKGCIDYLKTYRQYSITKCKYIGLSTFYIVEEKDLDLGVVENSSCDSKKLTMKEIQANYNDIENPADMIKPNHEVQPFTNPLIEMVRIISNYKLEMIVIEGIRSPNHYSQGCAASPVDGYEIHIMSSDGNYRTKVERNGNEILPTDEEQIYLLELFIEKYKEFKKQNNE